MRSSASDTVPASELDTVKSTSPAGILAGLGAQPCGVRVIVTVLAWAEPGADAVDPCGLEQPAAASTSPAATAASTGSPWEMRS